MHLVGYSRFFSVKASPKCIPWEHEVWANILQHENQ